MSRLENTLSELRELPTKPQAMLTPKLFRWLDSAKETKDQHRLSLGFGRINIKDGWVYATNGKVIHLVESPGVQDDCDESFPVKMIFDEYIDKYVFGNENFNIDLYKKQFGYLRPTDIVSMLKGVVKTASSFEHTPVIQVYISPEGKVGFRYSLSHSFYGVDVDLKIGDDKIFTDSKSKIYRFDAKNFVQTLSGFETLKLRFWDSPKSLVIITGNIGGATCHAVMLGIQ